MADAHTNITTDRPVASSHDHACTTAGQRRLANKDCRRSILIVKSMSDSSDVLDLAETCIYQIPTDGKYTITDINFLPNGSLAAHNENYAAIKLYSRDSDSNNKTRLLSKTTKLVDSNGTGHWNNFCSIRLLNDPIIVEPNKILSWEINKLGTGVVVPSGVLIIHFLVN